MSFYFYNFIMLLLFSPYSICTVLFPKTIPYSLCSRLSVNFTFNINYTESNFWEGSCLRVQRKLYGMSLCKKDSGWKISRTFLNVVGFNVTLHCHFWLRLTPFVRVGHKINTSPIFLFESREIYNRFYSHCPFVDFVPDVLCLTVGETTRRVTSVSFR